MSEPVTAQPDERESSLWTYNIESRDLYLTCLLGPAFGRQRTTLTESTPADRQPANIVRAGETLYAETASRFPPAAAVRLIRGLPLKVTQRTHITHTTEPWSGQAVPTRLRLTREIVDGPDNGPRVVDVEIDELTVTARGAIAELDRVSGASSRRVIDEYASRVVGEPVPDRAPSHPMPVFISYRLSRHDLAEQLHNSLQGYGGGAFVAPYLDKHELRAGGLRQQLREAIGARPVFFACATETFAQPGSVSAEELAFAQKAGVLIIPILVGSERPTFWSECKDSVSHIFADVREISPDSRSVGRLVELCLRSR